MLPHGIPAGNVGKERGFFPPQAFFDGDFYLVFHHITKHIDSFAFGLVFLRKAAGNAIGREKFQMKNRAAMRRIFDYRRNGEVLAGLRLPVEIVFF